MFCASSTNSWTPSVLQLGSSSSTVSSSSASASLHVAVILLVMVSVALGVSIFYTCRARTTYRRLPVASAPAFVPGKDSFSIE
eukprot:m.122774 g.122774  ORF g.122774 m.122774 type:complete len:83 (-) comp16575_c0_seq1:93-341(-)